MKPAAKTLDDALASIAPRMKPPRCDVSLSSKKNITAVMAVFCGCGIVLPTLPPAKARHHWRFSLFPLLNEGLLQGDGAKYVPRPIVLQHDTVFA